MVHAFSVPYLVHCAALRCLVLCRRQRDVNDSSTKTGMLFLVDLAGSEMVKKTHATGQVSTRGGLRVFPGSHGSAVGSVQFVRGTGF